MKETMSMALRSSLFRSHGVLLTGFSVGVAGLKGEGMEAGGFRFGYLMLAILRRGLPRAVVVYMGHVMFCDLSSYGFSH